MHESGKKVAERGPYFVVEWLEVEPSCARFVGYKVLGPDTQDWLFDTLDEAAAAMEVMAEADEETGKVSHH